MVVIILLLFHRISSSEDHSSDDYDELYEPYKCDASLNGNTRLVADLQLEDYDYEQVDKNSFDGRMEVCLPMVIEGYNFSVWSTICSSITEDTAHALCASLYYYDIGKYDGIYRSKQVQKKFNYASDDQPNWIDSLDCPTGIETNLDDCYYDRDVVSCNHYTDIYLECSDRITCKTCTSISCNYVKLSDDDGYAEELCSKDQAYCVRQVSMVDGEETEKYMGCAEDYCDDWLAAKRLAALENETYICHYCDYDNCNMFFLYLFDQNITIIGGAFVDFISFLMNVLNTGARLALLDVYAYLELFGF